ncbi:MAG: PDZ domain-containing protein, partial [Actinomycetota bacterium]|nr:PDZ domain-containing protein [Actinomycetota bacterium]
LTPSLARRLGLRVERGALIVSVSRGPGRQAGLRGGSGTMFFNGREVTTGGDVVVAVNGWAVRTGDDVIRIVAERLSPGERATFTVVRGSRRLDIPVRLAERPLDPSE